MINRKVLYFYEYASEIRGRCMGHARLLVCGHMLKITLAFSLPEWQKINCKLFLVAENNEGKVVVLELGEIMPCDKMTVYNLDVAEEKLEGMCICSIVHVGLLVRECEDRYIKAVNGVFDITSKSLDMLLGVENQELLQEQCQQQSKQQPCECQETEHRHREQQSCEQQEVKQQPCERELCEQQGLKQQEVGQQLWKQPAYQLKQTVEKASCDGVHSEKTGENRIWKVQSGNNEKIPMNTGREMTEKEIATLKGCVEKLMTLRPEYKPFGAGKITYSVRIGIGDVMGLSEFEPGLKDNSFLLHGFYKYKHIILASGMLRGRMNYYILVPGVKVEREQRIADMYGFHEFLSLDGQPAKAGTFGYYSWLLPS